MSAPERRPDRLRPVIAVFNLGVITWAVWHWVVPALAGVDWWELVKGAAATVVGVPLFLGVALFAFVIATARRR